MRFDGLRNIFFEFFRFFCHAKRLPWAFFWIFCVFYMGFTMFATFRRFCSMSEKCMRWRDFIFWWNFQKKMRHWFFSQKKYVYFFMIHKNFMDFIKFLWNSSESGGSWEVFIKILWIFIKILWKNHGKNGRCQISFLWLRKTIFFYKNRKNAWYMSVFFIFDF